MKFYNISMIFALTVVAFVHSFSAIAENNNINENMPLEKACTRGPEIQMRACMLNEYQNADTKMNEIYGKLVDVLKNPAGIKDSQSAWIKYRDKECSNEVFQLSKSGSIYPFQIHLCKKQLTEERIKRLDYHLNSDCNGCPPRK